MGLLNVYRKAGSEALGGTEKSLELGTVEVLKCCVCGAICFDWQVAPQCNGDCSNAAKGGKVPSRQVETSKISISDERLRTLELQVLKYMAAGDVEKGKELKELLAKRSVTARVYREKRKEKRKSAKKLKMAQKQMAQKAAPKTEGGGNR